MLPTPGKDAVLKAGHISHEHILETFVLEGMALMHLQFQSWIAPRQKKVNLSLCISTPFLLSALGFHP